MTPRLPLPTTDVSGWGLPDASGHAPALVAARRDLRRAAHSMTSVDPVITELVRMRNATFQQCVL